MITPNGNTNGVLVRLVPGLTLGPKIAVENPQGEFLGYFSFPELKEYATDPLECERMWKQTKSGSNPNEDPVMATLVKAVYEVYRISLTGLTPRVFDGISLLDFPPYHGAVEKLSALLGVNLDGRESLYKIVELMRAGARGEKE